MSASLADRTVPMCQFAESCVRPATHEFERAPGLGWIPLCESHARICETALPSGTLRRIETRTQS